MGTRTKAVSMLLCVCAVITLQLCLAQDLTQGVADASANNSTSQAASQEPTPQLTQGLATAGLNSSDALSQTPPLDGPAKPAVGLPLSTNITAAQRASVVAPTPSATTAADPGAGAEAALQPAAATVADAALTRQAVPALYQGILDRHNYYRSLHGAGQLSWSAALAYDAAAWASQCLYLVHDDTAGSMDEGENLWAMSGQSDASHLMMAIELWYAESASYDFSNPGFYPDTGHFTQVVWRDTTQLGCALQACSWGSSVVCRYMRAGNVVSPGNEYFMANVLPRQANPTPTPTPPPTPQPWTPTPQPWTPTPVPTPIPTPVPTPVPTPIPTPIPITVPPTPQPPPIVIHKPPTPVTPNPQHPPIVLAPPVYVTAPIPTPQPPAAPVPPPTPGPGVLPEGSIQSVGCLLSPNSQMKFCMSDQADLVLYNGANVMLWNNQMGNANRGVGPLALQMNQDGNLYVWDSTNTIIWSSNTAGRGVGPRRFMVQDSGYALIVDARGEITWYAPTYAGGRKLLR